MTDAAERRIAPTVIGSLDYVWSRISARLAGLDEIVRHGAEIALLRDLYPRLVPAQ